MSDNKQSNFDVSDFLENKNESDLIEILHKVQERFGYIPKESIVQISETLDVSVSKIYGVITFYSRFSLKPKGEYCISVCLGTACYVKGAEDVLNAMSKKMGIPVGDTTDDLFFSLFESKCVGACSNAPVVTVNDKVYKQVTKADVANIIANVKSPESDED